MRGGVVSAAAVSPHPPCPPPPTRGEGGQGGALEWGEASPRPCCLLFSLLPSPARGERRTLLTSPLPSCHPHAGGWGLGVWSLPLLSPSSPLPPSSHQGRRGEYCSPPPCPPCLPHAGGWGCGLCRCCLPHPPLLPPGEKGGTLLPSLSLPSFPRFLPWQRL